MKGRNGDPEQSESKHYVFYFLKRSMAPLPLTSTMTRRKQANTPLLPLLHPVVYELLRWRTDHRRHRLGVNRVPFIGVDTAGGPIRQPKHGWGRGRPMLSEPLQLTRSLGTLQTTVKLGKLPENMSPCVWYPCSRRGISRCAIWGCTQDLTCCPDSNSVCTPATGYRGRVH